MAKTQREMKIRSSRRGVNTHAALALARAYADGKGSVALARPSKPQIIEARPELKVVRRQRRQVGFRISNKVFIAYMTGFVALFAAVVMRAEMAATQLQLNRLDSKLVNVQTQHQRLEVQLAALESPQRIVSFAQTKLGMIYPSQVGYLGAALQPQVTQGATIPITPQVLASHKTLFAPSGEAGGSVVSAPTASSPQQVLSGASTSGSIRPATSSTGSPAIKPQSVSKSG